MPRAGAARRGWEDEARSLGGEGGEKFVARVAKFVFEVGDGLFDELAIVRAVFVEPGFDFVAGCEVVEFVESFFGDAAADAFADAKFKLLLDEGEEFGFLRLGDRLEADADEEIFVNFFHVVILLMVILTEWRGFFKGFI